jgi:hypothetical protein
VSGDHPIFRMIFVGVVILVIFVVFQFDDVFDRERGGVVVGSRKDAGSSN